MPPVTGVLSLLPCIVLLAAAAGASPAHAAEASAQQPGVVLQMEGEPKPAAPYAPWDIVKAGKVHQKATGYEGTYTWWPDLPQTIGPEGFDLELKVDANATSQQQLATGIGIIGGVDFVKSATDNTPAITRIAAYSAGAVDSKSFRVHIKPQKDYKLGQEVKLEIGPSYGPSVTYTYKIVSAGTGGISNAGPPSGSGATPTGTSAGGPGSTGPGTTTATEPCLDPAVQACIEKWLSQAESIRNRRDTRPTGPGGPWHFGPYGQLLGHSVISAQPPDGWASQYHSNRDCYVYSTMQSMNTDPAYGGELPSLMSFIASCSAMAGTGTGPSGGVPGAGSTPSGPPQPPTVSRMTLWAEKRLVEPGGSVSVPIWLLDATGVADMNFAISYDPSVVKPEGEIIKGSLLDNAIFTTNAAASGVIKLGFAQTSGITGSGPVAFVTFRAVGPAGSVSPLKLSVSTINDPAGAVLPIDLIDGEVRIATIGGPGSTSGPTGPGGSFPPGGTPPLGAGPGSGVLQRGDCDGDGVLTESDAFCALQMSVGNIPERMIMDMDGDGKVTARDAAIILQRAEGL